MKNRPPDETIGTDAATELYDLLRIAVDATRTATWRPGDSLESLLAPAVVAIAAEAGKAVRPHAEQVRAETIRGLRCGRSVFWSLLTAPHRGLLTTRTAPIFRRTPVLSLTRRLRRNWSGPRRPPERSRRSP